MNSNVVTGERAVLGEEIAAFRGELEYILAQYASIITYLQPRSRLLILLRGSSSQMFPHGLANLLIAPTLLNPPLNLCLQSDLS